MPTKKKTCFVISPIGDEGSDIRKVADDLFELILQPALEKYNFDVIRADKIPRTSVITTEIIQLVQEADLCIIDLTAHNPNVFYECGRRHEAGKPFIQIIKKGERLPFDLAGIRTLTYDLSTPRSTRDSVREIQRFIEEFEKAGFSAASSGVSLTTLASSIERIERKINQIFGSSPIPSFSSTKYGRNIAILKNPREAFMEAIATGDIDQAVYILPRLEQILGPTAERSLSPFRKPLTGLQV